MFKDWVSTKSFPSDLSYILKFWWIELSFLYDHVAKLFIRSVVHSKPVQFLVVFSDDLVHVEGVAENVGAFVTAELGLTLAVERWSLSYVFVDFELQLRVIQYVLQVHVIWRTVVESFLTLTIIMYW